MIKPCRNQNDSFRTNLLVSTSVGASADKADSLNYRLLPPLINDELSHFATHARWRELFEHTTLAAGEYDWTPEAQVPCTGGTFCKERQLSEWVTAINELPSGLSSLPSEL